MSIKPILFNTDEVRATLDGRKTTKRMVVKGAKSEWCYDGLSDDAAVIAVDRNGMEYAKSVDGLWATFEDDDGPIDFPMFKAPYRLGEILYVRETWRSHVSWTGSYIGCEIEYKAGGENLIINGSIISTPGRVTPWRSPVCMPREAARIWLRVTGVRVERVQEIGVDGCIKEGIAECPYDSTGVYEQGEFKKLWDSTIQYPYHKKYGWAANPFCWVISFERIRKDEAMQ